jgi:hydroxymethylpyrimidine pyrophosphatase-like HAD family hydrolase
MALPQNVEINQTHANKGEALLALADYLGVDHSKTISFGDGTNDLPMIKDAAIGIAMANADEAVIAAADWIAPSNDENGVAEGIKKYCLE